MRPLVVIDLGPAEMAGAARVDAIARSMEADGWVVCAEFRGPRPGERTVCTGDVADAETAREALLAALAGSALVVTAGAARPIVDGFLDDLRRLGPVDHVTAAAGQDQPLDADQRALLSLLADGVTLGEAAHELGLSRRTADRRLSAARRILGVATTAEAVVAFRARRGAPGR